MTGVDGRAGGRGCMYAYSRFVLLNGRNQHHVVKQLSPSEKFLKNRKNEKKMMR